MGVEGMIGKILDVLDKRVAGVNSTVNRIINKYDPFLKRKVRDMRKIIIGVFIGLILVNVTSYTKKVTSEDITIEVGTSSKFTEDEIRKAIACVKDNFGFPASTLTKIWYDEETSNAYVEGYLKSNDSVEGKNIIIILSDFYVDNSGDNPVLNRDTLYESMMWILIRDTETSNWEIKDHGY